MNIPDFIKLLCMFLLFLLDSQFGQLEMDTPKHWALLIHQEVWKENVK